MRTQTHDMGDPGIASEATLFQRTRAGYQVTAFDKDPKPATLFLVARVWQIFRMPTSWGRQQ
ncbi:MAG: hypothetical protein B6I35_03050 [Anaerolineaceae bacterium 4572_32.2]|nr:MAG: hypothetical protein B6I35_03050 [Anaerolineaceae bacterium 4572_32.2]RLC78561.1 MAG: hypothetical protein DRI81_06450 [Chloroflexota bacterium]